MTDKNKDSSSLFHAVFTPFGAYNSDNESPNQKSSEVLIGRDKERASFIRRLLNSGRSGAYLITGQRGTGKTSFVDYCLDEYEGYAFQRFIRTDIAKHLLDRMLMILFLAFIILLPPLLIELAAQSSRDTMGPIRLLVFFLGAILVIKLFTYSNEVVKTAFYRGVANVLSPKKDQPNRSDHFEDILERLHAILFIVGFCAYAISGFYILGPLLTLLINNIFFLLLISRQLGLNSKFFTTASGIEKTGFFSRWGSHRLRFLTYPFLFLIFPTCFYFFGKSREGTIESDQLAFFVSYEFTLLFFVLLTTLVFDLLKKRNVSEVSTFVKFIFITIGVALSYHAFNMDSEPKLISSAFLLRYTDNVKLSYIMFAVWLVLTAIGLYKLPNHFLKCYSRDTNKVLHKDLLELDKRIHGTEILVTLFKASATLIFLLSLCLILFDANYFQLGSEQKLFQLETQFYVLTFLTFLVLTNIEYESFLKNSRLVLEESTLRKKILNFTTPIPSVFKSTILAENSTRKYQPPKAVTKDPVARNTANTKETNAQNNAEEIEETEDEHSLKLLKVKYAYINYYNKLVRHSWIYLYMRFWVPVIKLKINLGFDNIQHKDIIFALLKELRKKYKDKFVSINSDRALFIKLISFIITLSLSILLSKLVFEFNTHNDNLNQLQNAKSKLIDFHLQKHDKNGDDYKSNLKVREETNAALGKDFERLKQQPFTYKVSTPAFEGIFGVRVYRVGNERDSRLVIFKQDTEKTKQPKQCCNNGDNSNIPTVALANSNETTTKIEETSAADQHANSSLAGFSHSLCIYKYEKETLTTNDVCKNANVAQLIAHGSENYFADELRFPMLFSLLYTQVFSVVLPERVNIKPNNSESSFDNHLDTNAQDAKPESVLVNTQVENNTPFSGENDIHQLAELFLADAIGFSPSDEILVFKSELPLEPLLFSNRASLLPSQRDFISSHESHREYIIHGYHVLAFFIVHAFFLLVNHFVPILPYRTNLKKIDQALNSLISTRTEAKSSKISNVVEFMKGETNVFRPQGSRDVEQAFMQIIEDITTQKNSLFGKLFSIPLPDITIIFDELDKLGSEIVTSHDKNDPKTRDSLSPGDTQRSLKIKELLSDLKNVITSAHCRFIFIGGRHLRDEWLADQTKRDQLLPSIFDKEIYLSSLLTDVVEESACTDPFLNRTKQYIFQQYRRSQKIFESLKVQKASPTLSLTPTERVKQQYADSTLLQIRTNSFFDHKLKLKSEKETSGNPFFISPVNTALPVLLEDNIKDKYLSQFSKFLVFRSHGIPKRLNEAFSCFIVPVGTVLGRSIVEKDIEELIKANENPLLYLIDRQAHDARSLFECNDVLLLNDIDLIRMQMVCRLYDRIERFMGRKLLNRDDKLVTAVFFLADFLFKFHRRAFSWDSLEKIDDLADIHRAPDLRHIMSELLEVFTELLLHPVLNGMYVFRFRSNIAREIEYISKYSPTDSAAFNFTLDESQALKQLYVSKLQDGSGGTPDIIIALGELYEYDQEYDQARKEYERALARIDQFIARKFQLDTPGDKPNVPGYIGILQAVKSAVRANKINRQSDVSHITEWAVQRLRLMLQIGMTFEQTRVYERAEAAYHESHVFAHDMLVTIILEYYRIDFLKNSNGNSADLEYLDNPINSDQEEHISGNDDALIEFLEGKVGSNKNLNSHNALFLAKHINLFYQPAFAKSWLVEKASSSVDTSSSIIEDELHFLDNWLPFKLNEEIEEAQTSLHEQGKIAHSNIGLIKSELHDKAGDLYFFKGTQNVEASRDSDNLKTFKTFLNRARYHYACSLHFIIKFHNYRFLTGTIKYGDNSNLTEATKINEQSEANKLFSPKQHTEFPLLAISSSMSDMAETIVASHSIVEVLRELKHGDCGQLNYNQLFDALDGTVKNIYLFVSGIHEEGDFSETEILRTCFYNQFANTPAHDKDKIMKGFIDDWFGKPLPNSQGHDLITRPKDVPFKLEYVLNYMSLNHLSVIYLQRAGYVEDAGYECCRGIETIESFLETILEIKRDTKLQERLNFATGKDNHNILELLGFLIKRAVSRVNKACGFFAVNRIDRTRHEIIEETGFISSRVYIAALKLCITTLKLSVEFENNSLLEGLRMVFRKPSSLNDESTHDRDRGREFSLDDGDTCFGDLTMQNLIHQLCVEQKLGDQEKYSIEEMFKPGLYTKSNGNGVIKGMKITADAKSVLPMFNKLVDKIMNTERYPIINRLTLLTLSINLDVFLEEKKEETSEETFAKISEKIKLLLELEEKYDSPNHFMPLYAVYSCFFFSKLLMDKARQCVSDAANCFPSHQSKDGVQETACAIDEIIRLISDADKFINEQDSISSDAGQLIGKAGGLLEIARQDKNFDEKQSEDMRLFIIYLEAALKDLQSAEYFFRQSREHLYKNEQMYTQRHQYYESIRDLYYLYDDFNDRYIHQVRAIQMMKSDVSYCLSKEIKLNLRVLNSLK